jgi:hypothetical protein
VLLFALFSGKMIFWNVIFDIGGYRKLSAIGLMVVRVSFEVKGKGEQMNFALGKISPKGKFRSSPEFFTLT